MGFRCLEQVSQEDSFLPTPAVSHLRRSAFLGWEMRPRPHEPWRKSHGKGWPLAQACFSPSKNKQDTFGARVRVLIVAQSQAFNNFLSFSHTICLTALSGQEFPAGLVTRVAGLGASVSGGWYQRHWRECPFLRPLQELDIPFVGYQMCGKASSNTLRLEWKFHLRNFQNCSKLKMSLFTSQQTFIEHLLCVKCSSDAGDR